MLLNTIQILTELACTWRNMGRLRANFYKEGW